MKKNVVLLLLVAFSLVEGFSQKVCETPEEPLDDLNSITKCSIEPLKGAKNKKVRQIKVRVSAPRKRFLKKRKKEIASTANSLSTSGLSEVAKTSEISNKLSIKKKSAATDIASLTNSLSKEEVRKAERFNSVDRVPSFDECKSVKDGDMFDCFNENMVKHIQKHFSYPSEAVRNMIQGEVWVRFVIDKNGDVRNIKTLGPDNAEILNEEAKRVVTKLSRFKPAKKDGKRVAVKYGFPINFSLAE